MCVLPRRVEALALLFVVEVAAAEDHTVVRTKSGAIYTFGLGERGVLGHGNHESKALPTRVDMEPFFESLAVLPSPSPPSP